MERLNDKYEGAVRVVSEEWDCVDISDKDGRGLYSHEAFLVLASPEIDWYYINDVGTYQGEVYAVGMYNGQIVLFKDFYGSCSGCGAWYEGGGPDNLEEVLSHAELFDNFHEAVRYIEHAWDPQNNNDLDSEVRAEIDRCVFDLCSQELLFKNLVPIIELGKH